MIRKSTCRLPLDGGKDGEGHALKRCIDSGTQWTNLFAVPRLQLQQEAVFWPSVDAAVFVVSPAYEHAVWIDTATQHHERQRVAAITSIIHKVAQKNQVAALTSQPQPTVDESLL